MAETKDVMAAYEEIGAMFLAMGRALADLHIRAWVSVAERLNSSSEEER